MIGVIIQLAISWLLLWLLEKKNLSVLGIVPSKERITDFGFGFFLAAVCYALYCNAVSYLTDNHWKVNPGFTGNQFLSASWWTFNSVLFEELIFRGALLYLLIQRTSTRTACIISAVAFGIYHWFSMGAWGSPMQMTYLFCSTGIWGLMLAIAFAKTRSLYFPVSLHLGWNLFQDVIYSQGPLGIQYLINSNNGKMLDGWLALGVQLFQVFGLPILVFVYLRKYYPSGQQQ